MFELHDHVISESNSLDIGDNLRYDDYEFENYKKKHTNTIVPQYILDFVNSSVYIDRFDGFEARIYIDTSHYDSEYLKEIFCEYIEQDNCNDRNSLVLIADIHDLLMKLNNVDIEPQILGNDIFEFRFMLFHPRLLGRAFHIDNGIRYEFDEKSVTSATQFFGFQKKLI